MVPQIARIEGVACDSAHEAAWLERNLLEFRRPRWNRAIGGQEVPGEEDCLVLNVWTPAPDDGLALAEEAARRGAEVTVVAANLSLPAPAGAEVVAVEKHGGRAKALAENSARLGATCVSVLEADALEVGGEYDRVLLDPPCSDLGTLQSRPDVRWKKSADTVARLVLEQEQLLAADSRLLACFYLLLNGRWEDHILTSKTNPEWRAGEDAAPPLALHHADDIAPREAPGAAQPAASMR